MGQPNIKIAKIFGQTDGQTDGQRTISFWEPVGLTYRNLWLKYGQLIWWFFLVLGWMGVDDGPTDWWTDGPNTFNIAWFPALGLGYLCAKFGEDWWRIVSARAVTDKQTNEPVNRPRTCPEPWKSQSPLISIWLYTKAWNQFCVSFNEEWIISLSYDLWH